MRRIIPHRPTTILSSFCAAVDGGRATIAAAGDGGFLPTDPKPNVRTPHTDIFGVFVGQSAWAVTVRKQLKKEERARKALGILFRDYGGRATQDEEDESDEEKVAKTNMRKFSEEELDVFLTNLAIECEMDHEKYEIVRKKFHEVIEKMTQDGELGDSTQNDRVDKLAEIAEEKHDTFLSNSFTTKLMIECEPKYVKRFCEIIEKVRKKMIQDDGILRALELVTNLMSRCDQEYEKLLCEVLEKVREKITQDGIDEKGGNDNIDDGDEKLGSENICKIEKLAKFDMKEGSFEETLYELVTETFITILRHVEEIKPDFMAYEVIEKVAKKVGNENVRKITEKKLDALVTDLFVFETVGIQMDIPHYKFSRLMRSDDESDEEKVAKTNIRKLSEEELAAFLTNLAIECGTDHEKYKIVCKKFHEVIEKMTEDDELGDATRNVKVDKLAEIAEKDMDAFLTNSFTTKLMIECDPKYEKRFREIIEKVRKRMILDNGILEAFELVTDFMKCEPEYEKLLCEVLEKVREKITQDDRDKKGGNESIRKIKKLTKLDILAKLDKVGSFEKTLDEFVTAEFLTNLRDVEETKPDFMAYEVIEKVAKKVGNENVRKIAERELDALVTDSFVFQTVGVQMNIPHFKYVRLMRSAGGRDSAEE